MPQYWRLFGPFRITYNKFRYVLLHFIANAFGARILTRPQLDHRERSIPTAICVFFCYHHSPFASLYFSVHPTIFCMHVRSVAISVRAYIIAAVITRYPITALTTTYVAYWPCRLCNNGPRRLQDLPGEKYAHRVQGRRQKGSAATLVRRLPGLYRLQRGGRTGLWPTVFRLRGCRPSCRCAARMGKARACLRVSLCFGLWCGERVWWGRGMLDGACASCTRNRATSFLGISARSIRSGCAFTSVGDRSIFGFVYLVCSIKNDSLVFTII